MSNTAFKKRLTYSTSWFNDWWVHARISIVPAIISRVE